MYYLYGAYGCASFPAHTILELSGANYNFIAMDLLSKPSDEYLKLQPYGKIPALLETKKNGSTISMFESAAICIYLADCLPQSNLAPTCDSPERADYLQWMSFLSINLQEQFYNSFYPKRYVNDPKYAVSSKENAQKRIKHSFSLLNEQLLNHPLLAGDSIYTCDLYLLMLSSWHEDRAELFNLFPAIENHYKLVCEHPVIHKMFTLYDGD